MPEMRSALDDLDPGLTALVGGGSAIQYDFDQAIESDLKLIAPVALLVIAIILAILLRALVAPLVLIASVILSFLCTLGLSVLFIRYVVGDPGLDASIPTFAFIFLVALGIDYTIFLMARVREEARQLRHPRGDAAGACRDRAGDHLRRDHPRRHLLGADDAAGHLHLRPRVHGRARDPARHVHRADDHGPGRDRAPGRQDLVAVDGRVDGGLHEETDEEEAATPPPPPPPSG